MRLGVSQQLATLVAVAAELSNRIFGRYRSESSVYLVDLGLQRLARGEELVGVLGGPVEFGRQHKAQPLIEALRKH